MGDFRANIPGWLDAVKSEAQAHEMAFAAPYDVVAGYPVRHLSLVDLCRLAQLESPFVSDEWPSFASFRLRPALREAAAELIAYQHIEYRPSRRWLNRRRVRALRSMDAVELYSELGGYFERTFTDQQPTNDRKGRASPISHWSGIVGYVDLLGSEYGWTADTVMHMPYRQIIQIVRKIAKRKDPKAPISSRAEQVQARYLRAKREARERERSGKEDTN